MERDANWDATGLRKRDEELGDGGSAVPFNHLRVRDPNRPRLFRAPLWWLVGAITIIGSIVFFFSLRPSTQMWFLIWNAIGLGIYFTYGVARSRVK